jgi:hypothetical protein
VNENLNPPHTVLVVANETIAGRELHELVDELAAENASDVLVVAPALNSRFRHWISDEDSARRKAGRRLDACLEKLAALGVKAKGWIGDADPLRSIADALHLHIVDEIVIATHPEGRSNWLERNIVDRARGLFPQPIHHVVVDGTAAERLAA